MRGRDRGGERALHPGQDQGVCGGFGVLLRVFWSVCVFFCVFLGVLSMFLWGLGGFSFFFLRWGVIRRLVIL